MGIEKITSKISSAINEIGTKGKSKVQEVIAPAVKTVKNGKNKLVGSLDALANNAKASIVKNGEKKSSKIAQSHRFDALVSEGLASGLNKKEATKGAQALVSATGVFASKDASKSADLLKDIPLPQAIRKQELLAKYGDKLSK